LGSFGRSPIVLRHLVVGNDARSRKSSPQRSPAQGPERSVEPDYQSPVADFPAPRDRAVQSGFSDPPDPRREISRARFPDFRLR
jgi:hypothetical protein